MSRARSNIAARTTIPKLREAALAAFSRTRESAKAELATVPDFDGVLDFCNANTEDLGGETGCDAWYFHQVGPWAVMGDLGVLLQKDERQLSDLGAALGVEIIVCAIDTAFEYAFFAAYDGSKLKRRLILEDEEFTREGLPVQGERGRPTVDFDEDEAILLWTSYKLPTFEEDPVEGPFFCQKLRRKE